VFGDTGLFNMWWYTLPVLFQCGPVSHNCLFLDAPLVTPVLCSSLWALFYVSMCFGVDLSFRFEHDDFNVLESILKDIVQSKLFRQDDGITMYNTTIGWSCINHHGHRICG
jgi:hypothetical protein